MRNSLKTLLVVVAIAIGGGFLSIRRPASPAAGDVIARTVVPAGAWISVESQAQASLFGPNQAAVVQGAGLCINATALDGGVACLYNFSVDSAGNLVVTANTSAGATGKIAWETGFRCADAGTLCATGPIDAGVVNP